MKAMNGTGIRPDGKASFDEIYDGPTPAAYFSVLRPLQYLLPGHAQPMVLRCMAALQRRRGLERVTVLDLCAGYGINAALIKCNMTMQDLYARFATHDARAAGAERIPADAAWFQRRRRAAFHVRVVAQDVSQNALSYSEAVGLVDATVATNLEECDPTPEQVKILRDADLVLVTGGLSYIGARTFSRVLRAARRRPWALYYPLRHTDVSEIDETLEDLGYGVETSHRPIAQRRYRSAEEQQAIRKRTMAQAAPGEPAPSPTHLEASIKLARPLDEMFRPPFDEITFGPAGTARGRNEIRAGCGGPQYSGI
jgi:hypothetical protein